MIDLKRTDRATGLLYLAFALFGLVGYLLIRPRIHIEGNPAETFANLTDQPALARLGIAAELGIVVTQALVALWFYKLFQSLNQVAAWAVGGFGLVNAVAILCSAACMATAVAVAADPSLAPGGDAAATAQLLYELSANFWGVGSLFFGLWLLPMGQVAATSGRMPRLLGVTLVVGGIGYLLSAFVDYGFSDAPSWLVDGLTVPAGIGEFWMIGFLLFVGIRPGTADTSIAGAAPAAQRR